MDMQVGIDDDDIRYLVLGGRLAIHFDNLDRDRLASFVEVLRTPRDGFDRAWEVWADRRGNSRKVTPFPKRELEERGDWHPDQDQLDQEQDEALDALYTIFTGFPPPPRPPRRPPLHPPHLPPPPARPAYVYGHLPFFKTTGNDDVFYRYESFPTSIRILRPQALAPHLRAIAPDGGIVPGTYAAPASELPFMPTGLAAVARQALPSLMPARWRWELQPVIGTGILFGTSVPLYGQSGGGVEVRFDHPPLTASRSPIANPVVLPVL